MQQLNSIFAERLDPSVGMGMCIKSMNWWNSISSISCVARDEIHVCKSDWQSNFLLAVTGLCHAGTCGMGLRNTAGVLDRRSQYLPLVHIGERTQQVAPQDWLRTTLMGCCPVGVLMEAYVDELNQDSTHIYRGSNFRKQVLIMA
jgi:hypothetical protein